MRESEARLMCPHCGWLYPLGLAWRDSGCLVPEHHYPAAPDLCPGTGQNPRNPESDRRPLWKDLPGERPPARHERKSFPPRPSSGPGGLPVEEMLRDVEVVEKQLGEAGLPYVLKQPLADLCCHVRALAEALAVADEQVKVAAARAQKYRDGLLRVAARAGDWSALDLWVVADALGLTLAQLEDELRGEAS